MNHEWENETSRITPIADQMVKALWLEYGTSQNGMAFRWTELGLIKVKQLSDIYTELEPVILEVIPDSNCLAVFWALILRAAVEHGYRDSL
jgi:hypothetical protein